MNTSKLWLLSQLFLFAAFGALQAAPPVRVHKNEITQVDAAAGTVTVFNDRGEAKVYRVTAGTEILINNQRGTIADLAPGMPAQVTTSGPGAAERISVESKPVSPTAKIRVPATASADNPVVVGTVKAGQVVSVVPIKVWWCGGGSKKKIFCDWNGYNGSDGGGFPWMALVAAVGKEGHAPKNNVLTFTVQSSGTLVLYANDGKPQDNVGDGDVTVTISDQ